MTASTRILIVEDEMMIAMMLEEFLDIVGAESAGVAESVSDAMRLLSNSGIDAAIVDVNLRDGESSEPICARLDELGIPFAISSGNASGFAYGDRPLLAKPYSIDQLEDVLRALKRVAVAAN